MVTMVREMPRKIGLEVVGDAPWGTHFCQFYSSKEDLVDILVPYFKSGLENNEYCMWVTSEPLGASEAAEALNRALPDYQRYLAGGQLEIIPYTEWYVQDGRFESQRVLDGWVDRLERALAKGFDGLRLTGNTFWLEQAAWQDFTDYEEAVNGVIGKYRMIALCTYCLGRCGAAEVIDVIKNHQFALIKQGARWETIESAERKRLNEALLASEERYRQIVDTATEGIWVVDTGNVTTFANRRMAEILGYPAEEMIGRPMLDFVDEEGRALIRMNAGLGPSDWQSGRGDGEPHDVQLWRKNGSRLWAIVSATPIVGREGRHAGTLYMVTDISERKAMEAGLVRANERLQVQTEELATQAEELAAQTEELVVANDALLETQGALRKSETRYRWLFERLDEGFALHEIICDEQGKAQDYRFLDVNPAFERMTGLRREAVVGRTVREVLPGVEDYWIRTYGEVAVTGKAIRFENYAGPLDKYFEVIAFSAELGQFATLFIDISERKRVEQEREGLLRQKDEFLSIAAHELRSPMTAMKGFAQVLMRRAERLPNGEEWLPHLGRIDTQVNRMAELVERLLHVSRIQLGRLDLCRDQVDLAMLAQEAVAEARMATQKHTITLVAPAELVGHWDGGQLRQVLANLLSNAVEYSPQGGAIEVVVAQRDGEAVVSVRDEGVGIPRDKVERLFERYYRSEEAQQVRAGGMGLGLFICHGIVAAHGGRIWVESGEGKGSKFWFALPLARE